MTHDEAARVLKLHQEWRMGREPYDKAGCPMPHSPKGLTAALDYAIAVLGRDNLIKSRLAQIASGDYKACGHTAEDVAKTALLEFHI